MLRIIAGVLLLLVLLSIFLSLPIIQTKVAKYVTSELNKSFGISIEIDKIAITFYGDVKIAEVLISDYRKDTLFYAHKIDTDILNVKDWYKGNLHFGTVKINGLYMKMINYKGEKLNNLDVFVAAFDDKNDTTPSTFLMTVKKVKLKNTRFSYIDYDYKDPIMADFTNISTQSENLLIQGVNVSVDVKNMAFKDYRGLKVTDFNAQYSYSLTGMKAKNIKLKTKKSSLEGDLSLRYTLDDFSDFNNKVQFDGIFKNSKISTTDLKYFYSEFAKGQPFYLNTKIYGTLNNLTFNQLYLEGKNNTELIGDVTLKNSFGKADQIFSMNGNFRKLTTNYDNLVNLLPNLLGKTLHESVKKLEDITVRGTTFVTSDELIADISVLTALGDIDTKFSMNNMTDVENAGYEGNVNLKNFDLGTFINQPKVGGINANLDIEGIGFTESSLNTMIDGKINSIYLNKYNYTNISLNGNFKKPIFEGLATIDDPNLKMTFDGLINFKQNDNKYLFQSTIDYADLCKLKLSTKDTVSLLKGEVDIDLQGTTIDDVYGNVTIKNASYVNPLDTYIFNDFEITSSFDENKIRTITVNSPDIINGKMEGRFYFKEFQKMAENALGDTYAHYSPHKVSPNQYVNFNFNIYNKIIDVFLPEVSFGKNTFINGRISTQDHEFKLKFNSPDILAYQNQFYNVYLDIDNKNPSYTTFISLDSLRNKKYKISEFKLNNTNRNDTLFVKTDFKGGEKSDDIFNLNLYHTINADKKSVVGFKKSEINFKNYSWFINENNNTDNSVVFEKSLDKFTIKNIGINHGNQLIQLNGKVKDSTYKDLKLSFTDVPLNKITPEIDNVVFDGKLNGAINFAQDKEWYKPNATVQISDFTINQYNLGIFELNVKGDPFLKNFEVNSTIKNDDLESFSAIGNIALVDKKSVFDLDLKLNEFNLATLSPLGGEIINNIKGKLSGRTSLIGTFDKPEVNGRFYLDNTSLNIPYLNVNYVFENKSIVDVTTDKFMFQNINFEDKIYKTSGKLDGHIVHDMFADWFLDLKVRSNKLLVLDTQDSEDAIYYGTAFIQGSAKIKGPTNALVIDVKAKSQKGTEIKIPISDSESLGDNTYIKFLSEKEKYKTAEVNLRKLKEYKGLEMAFDLDITPDATLEVIIDRLSGHGIKGKGFGNILLNINTLGKFNMWGDFLVHEGYYNFKYGGVIGKKFEVTNGSSIRWEGDPLRAILNLEAVYKTQANPSVLIDNPSFNRNVPVNVKIKLTDQLIKPEVDFIIDFPTVSSVLKSELQYKLDEKNTRQTQALYLLSSGGFLSASNAGQNAVTGNLFERASSLINGVLEDEDSKFKVNVNYVQRNETAFVQTEGRVGLTFSSQINDRISVNGKFGVPTGGVTQSGVIGEANVEWRLSNDNSFHARFFNKENDINYLGEGIGYTQGVGLSYQIDFNNFKTLLKKLSQKSKETPVEDQELKLPDSFITPERIEIPKKKTDTKELFKENMPEYE